MKKTPRAFSPPTPRPKPLDDEEIKKLAMEKLSDPKYEPTSAQVAVDAQKSPSGEVLPLVQSADAEAKKTPQKAAESPVDENPQEFPWDNLDGVKKTNLLYEIPPETVAKMNWVIDNVPRMSRQRIVRDAVAAELDRMIALYYKP